MRFLGAKVVLTPRAQKGYGMYQKAVELAEANGWFLARRFANHSFVLLALYLGAIPEIDLKEPKSSAAVTFLFLFYFIGWMGLIFSLFLASIGTLLVITAAILSFALTMLPFVI